MKKTIPALTFDIEKDGWEASRGFIMRQIPMPALDEANNPKDRVSVILKIKYAGVCGSDRGIWNRNAFKDAIHNS
ncbi:MAG: theronine dehydrogenase, partial [Patescibacteria group bacterium]